MPLRFPKVLPSYAYRDPAEFVRFDGAVAVHMPAPAARVQQLVDRYYTRARRLHVKQLMKGKA